MIDRVTPYVVESFLNQLPPAEKVGDTTVLFQFADEIYSSCISSSNIMIV